MTVSRARAARALQVEIIDELDRAESIAADWAELADCAGAGPLSTPAFALAWWRHLGRGELRLVTVRNGAGELIGLGPFHERRFGRLAVLRWIGHGLGTVGSLVTAESKADAAGTIWSTVERSARLLDLTEYRHGGAGLDELRRSDRWSAHAELRDQCPTIHVDRFDSVTDLLAGPNRRGLRKNLAKLDRGLAGAEHDLRFDVVTAADELPDAIAAIDPIYDAAEHDDAVTAPPPAHSGCHRPGIGENAGEPVRGSTVAPTVGGRERTECRVPEAAARLVASHRRIPEPPSRRVGVADHGNSGPGPHPVGEGVMTGDDQVGPAQIGMDHRRRKQRREMGVPTTAPVEALQRSGRHPPVQTGGLYDVGVGDGDDHPTRRPDAGELAHN